MLAWRPYHIIFMLYIELVSCSLESWLEMILMSVQAHQTGRNWFPTTWGTKSRLTACWATDQGQRQCLLMAAAATNISSNHRTGHKWFPNDSLPACSLHYSGCSCCAGRWKVCWSGYCWLMVQVISERQLLQQQQLLMSLCLRKTFARRVLGTYSMHFSWAAW